MTHTRQQGSPHQPPQDPQGNHHNTMTARDITGLTPHEPQPLPQQPLDPGTRKALRAEIQRRPAPTPPRPETPQAPPPKPATPPELLLRPTEVAILFGVSVSTVRAWVSAGKLTCTRTPGGQRRYHAAEVYALRNTPPTPPAPRADEGGGLSPPGD